MQTFDATELSREPKKIFRVVDLEGAVKINHDRYPDKIFVLSAKVRGEVDNNEDEQQLI